jgi:hypothetical protein
MEPMYDNLDAEAFAKGQNERARGHLDYNDVAGSAHVMCACGHYVTGPVLGTNIALCPNCEFRARLGESIAVVYPDRLPTARGVPAG